MLSFETLACPTKRKAQKHDDAQEKWHCVFYSQLPLRNVSKNSDWGKKAVQCCYLWLFNHFCLDQSTKDKAYQWEGLFI